MKFVDTEEKFFFWCKIVVNVVPFFILFQFLLTFIFKIIFKEIIIFKEFLLSFQESNDLSGGLSGGSEEFEEVCSHLPGCLFRFRNSFNFFESVEDFRIIDVFSERTFKGIDEFDGRTFNKLDGCPVVIKAIETFWINFFITFHLLHE